MSRLTKLEAVNNVLAAAGEIPVNTIDSPTTANAAIALRLVEVVHRETLALGWDWNTEYRVGLEVDINTGTIPVPSNYLRVSVEDAPWVKHRGSKLYDRSSQSYLFEAAVECTVIKYLPWDDLPEEAKTYIWAMAAVRYSTYRGTSDATLTLLRQQAFVAESALREQDADVGNYSIFDSPDIAVGLPRGNMYVPGSPYAGRSISDDRTPK
jgi:hypothetical protein